MSARASAVVFAYHNVGVRALKALLGAGVDVRLVVTHEDAASETIWFDSVGRVAADYGLKCVTFEGRPAKELLELCRAAQADFVFSFYFRKMLASDVLATARRGAFNVHGSLLPKYRGRAPVNWAILNGERETGATLHVMDAKPDHGAIVDQMAVPILPDDTAREVFDKVTLAAEVIVARTVPRLIDGSAPRVTQTHLAGHYFGGRRPDDGRIPSGASAQRIHDLVRAVAPPEYPGAFFDARGHRFLLARTLPASPRTSSPGSAERFAMFARDTRLWIRAADGALLRVISATVDGAAFEPATFAAMFGGDPIEPDDPIAQP